MKTCLLYLFRFVPGLLTFALPLSGARLAHLQFADDRCLILAFRDGEVRYHWDDPDAGSCNGWNAYYTEDWHLCPDKDAYVPFGPPLELVAGQDATHFTLTSEEDPHYGGTGRHPVQVNRKSKVWEASHDERLPAMHHWLYLELPASLVPGVRYTLQVAQEIGSDTETVAFKWDPFEAESPAIKVSQVGYPSTAPHKFADIYLWCGDGGERDFSRLDGTAWHLYNTETGRIDHSGELVFRMRNGPEPRYGMDFTGADVWQCDFSDFRGEGSYRLVVEGMGASPEFPIRPDPFGEAFRTAMQGMFYQRMGCAERPAGGFPPARRPLFRQGVEPEGFKVLISARDIVTGVNPDRRDWYAEALTGEVAPETWGGWSDAYDNDQRPLNFICVFDLLLTYHLRPEAFTDGQLYVPEHGNGIPDLLDEALWEIDWWLRMRDAEGGYLTGLTNIKPPETINYAGAPCAWQGWCVAAGAAMVADCFRLAGNDALVERYRAAALEAYRWAERQEDPMLDTAVGELRGRDLRMTAAAFLFNLTGKREFESVVREETVVDGPRSRVRMIGERGQQYATVGYLSSPQEVAYPELQAQMIASITHQAQADHLRQMETSPTMASRWASTWEGEAKASAETSLLAIAHRFAEDPALRSRLAAGLLAEAEWTLGRNPLGLVLMTGLTDRSVTQTFAPGRRDGHPGVTPGWTPFMCRDGWKNADDIHRCEWYTNRNHPADKELWPHGEHFWNSRYCVPNSEATPQQTFRQKIVLYGYLHALYGAEG